MRVSLCLCVFVCLCVCLFVSVFIVMSNNFCLLNFHYLIKHILCVFVFMCMYACVCVYVYVCVCVCIALHSITLCLRGVLSHNQKTITQPAYIPLSSAPGQEKTGGSYRFKASESTVNV